MHFFESLCRPSSFSMLKCTLCLSTIVTVDSITFEYHLLFSSVSDGDIGSYKCEATNDAGTDEDRVILNLIGKLVFTRF